MSERADEMERAARPVAREGAGRDGLAAVAVTILAALLIVYLVSQIV
jgi:hypothetical protein